MRKVDLDYTHTRLEIGSVATVFVAVNEVKNVLEVQEPVLILDNERTGKETTMALNKGGYKILKEYFESTHGKVIDKIDIEEMSIICCREIPNLEDEYVFTTIEECFSPELSDEEGEILYTMTLTEKGSNGRYHSIKLSKDAYIALVEYCRR